MKRAFYLTAAAAVAVLAAAAPAALAAAPNAFPVYDAGRQTLVTAHPVTSGERLVIAGRPVTLGAVTHPGPAYVAHVLGGPLPAAWTGRMLPAVPELP